MTDVAKSGACAITKGHGNGRATGSDRTSNVLWRHRSQLCAYVLCSLVMAMFSAPALGEAASKPSDEAQAARDFLVQGIAERASHLKSALFTARGEQKGNSGDPEDQVFNGKLSIHGAIDGLRLRFDYGEPGYSHAPDVRLENLATPTPREELDELTREQAGQLVNGNVKQMSLRDLGQTKGVLSRVETYFIRTPENVATWHSGLSSMFLSRANKRVAVRCFDVNALGLYGYLEFQEGKPLEELLNDFRVVERCEVKEAGNGVVTLSQPFDESTTLSHWEISIDTRRGFTPLRAQMIEYNKKTGVTAVTQSSDTTWSEINGAWVPKTFKIWCGSTNPKGVNVYHSQEFTFAFERVNEPIDDTEFSYKSFPASPDVAVIDETAQNPIRLRQPSANQSSTAGAVVVGWMRSRAVLILLALNLAALSALLVISWRRGTPATRHREQE
jgi:hypothetical protein